VCHRAKRTGAIVGCTRAPAAVAAVVAIERRAGVPLTAKPDTGKSSEMRAGNTFRQCLFHCFDDRIDDGRKRLRIVSHWRGRLRAQNFAFRQNKLEWTKGALIGRFVMSDQILERHPGGGPPAAVIT
jgi:hypothetical protein